MRINGINNVNAVYKTNRARKAYGTSKANKSTDSVAISDFAKELSIANRAVKNSPEVRTEKVVDIKARMEAGSYNITAADVADKLVEKYYE